MKTPEEINILKEEVKNLNRKLTELTEEELTKVTGGNLEFVYDRELKMLRPVYTPTQSKPLNPLEDEELLAKIQNIIKDEEQLAKIRN